MTRRTTRDVWAELEGEVLPRGGVPSADELRGNHLRAVSVLRVGPATRHNRWRVFHIDLQPGQPISFSTILGGETESSGRFEALSPTLEPALHEALASPLWQVRDPVTVVERQAVWFFDCVRSGEHRQRVGVGPLQGPLLRLARLLTSTPADFAELARRAS